VVFRGAGGRPGVLEDRCPHRNAPLSAGRVHDGELECAYHGWRFDGCGGCVAVPGLDLGGGDSRAVPSHATVERDGVVWFWPTAGEEPEGEPFPLPELGAGTREVVLRHDIGAPMAAVIENTLDVPHTAFLHRGLLRGAEPNQITAERRAIPRGVEVQYFGEPLGLGFLRPGGRAGDGTAPTLEHFDRFVLPCIAQVEYHAGPWLDIVNTVVHLPLREDLTRTWFILRARSDRLPSRLVQGVIRVQGPFVARQDARMLERQAATIERFGGERFTSTDLDLMSTAIWRLLRAADRDDDVDVEPRTVTFRA
jgi:phenylpropionate dioxygenase-like ring-hydroxylating dioxygenase large terminal subunit